MNNTKTLQPGEYIYGHSAVFQIMEYCGGIFEQGNLVTVLKLKVIAQSDKNKLPVGTEKDVVMCSSFFKDSIYMDKYNICWYFSKI